MKVIIHGGFFSESSTDKAMLLRKQQAMKAIVENVFNFLKTHSAYETSIYGVELLENDVLFNAGLGSQIQSDGKIRMSAAVMDGSSLRFSGVINIENIKNPIRLAERLNQEEDRVLGGEPAKKFAAKIGIEDYNPSTQQREAEYEAKLLANRMGTVGCVALDANGRIAAATSTGGKGFEIPGRISDSATVAGNYANEFCGVSCTGVGEDITSIAVAAKIVTRVSDGMKIEAAFEKSFAELKEINGFAGAIGIDGKGNLFFQESHKSMVYAHFDGNQLGVFAG